MVGFFNFPSTPIPYRNLSVEAVGWYKFRNVRATRAQWEGTLDDTAVFEEGLPAFNHYIVYLRYGITVRRIPSQIFCLHPSPLGPPRNPDYNLNIIAYILYRMCMRSASYADESFFIPTKKARLRFLVFSIDQNLDAADHFLFSTGQKRPAQAGHFGSSNYC